MIDFHPSLENIFAEAKDQTKPNPFSAKPNPFQSKPLPFSFQIQQFLNLKQVSINLQSSRCFNFQSSRNLMFRVADGCFGCGTSNYVALWILRGNGEGQTKLGSHYMPGIPTILYNESLLNHPWQSTPEFRIHCLCVGVG